MRASLIALLLGLSTAAHAGAPAIPTGDLAALLKVRTLRHISFEALQACASFNEPGTLEALTQYSNIWMARYAVLARRLDLLYMGLPTELTGPYEQSYRKRWSVGDSALDTLTRMKQSERNDACKAVVQRLLPSIADPEAILTSHRSSLARIMSITDTDVQRLTQQLYTDPDVRNAVARLIN
ncbi:hypothetical protein [Chitinimonas lacunae]|uniref:DUF2059 domain-containing protein n=1 Tax=Chitinimonas lacunae TaxID=1963018 RepID=A0ABV8MRG3_9NEIS